MNFLIILKTHNEQHLEEFHKLIGDYDASIRVNTNTWVVNTSYDIQIIRMHLASLISIHDSLLIFKVDKEHSFTNHLDLSDWMEDINDATLVHTS